MNTPVSFEIAKLLKEKEFNIPQLYFYIDGDISWKVDNTRCRNQIEGEYAAPTIAEVVMWLFDKHGIWINGGLYAHLGNVSKFQFTIESQKSRSTNSIVQLNINPFNSPTEAYEAAIEYTLKNFL